MLSNFVQHFSPVQAFIGILEVDLEKVFTLSKVEGGTAPDKLRGAGYANLQLVGKEVGIH